ncbi:transcription antitermination factor NusB [Desulfovibrio ferrophilus]|uniref:Transcription antitermination protein NusB n=1 Tax=Desulfovibrio ferrophilus TaxID=241368 RepID=A0A2Z6B0F5_9BACT|nr:transcription antitermination factor NusB [Desulfovibrio ferrophilus]BBD08953.1 N utilization substance protein B homolog [Desulfovibrio ferrophilus]
MPQKKKGGRRTGRRRAFEVLYGLTFAPVETMDDVRRLFKMTPERNEELEQNPDGNRSEFAWTLVSGVWSNTESIDETVTKFSQHWKIKRIARVELTILRLALYEMLHVDDVPLKVAINEAIELAKRFGDDNSKNFINGILDAVAKAIENGELRVR